MTDVVLPVELDRADGRRMSRSAQVGRDGLCRLFSEKGMVVFSIATTSAKHEIRQGTLQTACHLKMGYAWYSRSGFEGVLVSVSA